MHSGKCICILHNSDKHTSLRYPFIPHSHPKHPCAVILYSIYLIPIGILIKGESKKKINCINANNFLSTSFWTTLCTYYKIIHSNLLLFENSGRYKCPRLESRSKHHFISYCKRFKSFYYVSILDQKQKKSKGKASTKLGNPWNKGKGKHLKKKVNILLNFESVNLSTNKNMIHPTFPQKLQYFFQACQCE